MEWTEHYTTENTDKRQIELHTTHITTGSSTKLHHTTCNNIAMRLTKKLFLRIYTCTICNLGSSSYGQVKGSISQQEGLIDSTYQML